MFGEDERGVKKRVSKCLTCCPGAVCFPPHQAGEEVFYTWVLRLLFFFLFFLVLEVVKPQY